VQKPGSNLQQLDHHRKIISESKGQGGVDK
jgi:hypothetical protein